MPESNRRIFSRRSAAALLTAETGSQAMADSDKQDDPHTNPIPLGGAVHVPAEDPDAWLKTHRDPGYRAACCPPASANDTQRLQAIRDALAKHDVVMAKVEKVGRRVTSGRADVNGGD